jgi:hypothetical protein
MREVVTAADLQKKISDAIEAKLEDRQEDRRGTALDILSFWLPVPVRCERIEDGPNWRLDLDPKKVPAAFAAVWESIRSEFEERYNIAES